MAEGSLEGSVIARPGSPPDPTATLEPRAEEREESTLRGAVRLFFASGAGKAGAGLFLLLLGICVYVLLTFPSDFGRDRWSNPAVWADNPKAAPPAWTAWFRDDVVEQQAFTLGEPAEVRPIPAGEVRLYRAPISFEANAFPTSFTATLTGITFHGRPPVVALTLLRPDGGQVPLASVVAPGPRPGETVPYRRFYDTPERVVLTSQPAGVQGLGQAYAQLYPGVPVPADLAGRLQEGLFGRPAADGSGRLEPLPGEYTLQAQVAVADPTDEIAPIRTVLGGTVFGWAGTDTIGRDLREGLLYGFPIALLIAVLAAVLVTAIGAGLGILSGYAGGTTDAVIQRLSDIVSNVPVLPLLIFLVFILGANLWLIILALVAFSWPGLTILIRSMVLQIRSGQLVEAARALGASRVRIMRRHVFPQVAPFIVAQMIFSAPNAILAEAGLSFLGLGDQTKPTWGQMLQAGFQTGAIYLGYWWWVIPPGLLIIVTALAFMLLALAMEPIVDPRLRKPGS